MPDSDPPMSLINKLKCLRNNNPYFSYLWMLTGYERRKCKIVAMSDEECIRYYYNRFSGCTPDLRNPQKFSEKMQWMKLHYRNDLMPVVGDKYAVRQYLADLGYSYLLNDLIAVYDNISQFRPDQLPESFVLKATHSSGWNLIVPDKSKQPWGINRKLMQYWLTHDIAWDGREWHYGLMKPRIVCERYLTDETGGLMDYKFYCMNGRVRFMQLNVGRNTENSTQNYYDLDWHLLPFGKSQPHNPDIHAGRPHHFDEMVRLATELSKPFPYVRIDFYETDNRVYFGEFTFFPCSGMPDFIPAEYDDVVGRMLTLPQANR